MPRRILFLTDRYPPHHTGGYEIACKTIAEALGKRGWDTRVLTSTFGIARPRRDGRVWRVLHRPEDATTLAQLGWSEIADDLLLNTTLRLWRPHVAYAWCLRQLYASLHATLSGSGIPTVFNIADVWWPDHLADGRAGRALWAVNGATGGKALAKRAGITAARACVPTFRCSFSLEELGSPYVISCSAFRLDQHLQLRLPATDPVVIYNGIDTSLFDGVPDSFDELRLLFSGRLVPEKGAHTAIRAVARLLGMGIDRVRLTIAGVRVFPWEYSDGLRRLVAEHGLHDHVTFVDSVPHDDMADLYRRHNVLLFPSQCAEGLPMTMLEAMSTGLLVVGSTTGGSAEILHQGRTGYVVAPEDHAGLADALVTVMKDQVGARRVAAEGQRKIRAVADLNVIADQTEAYLERAIEKQASMR